MTDSKTRVKDLSAELGVSNKELLQALRELGVQAKSHMSVVEEEFIDQVKTKFQNHDKVTEVVRKEVQPGVIVRRRRKTVKKAAETEAAPEEKPLEAPEEAKAKAPAKAAEAHEAEPVAEEATEQDAAEEAAPPVQETATIVKPAESAAEEPVEAEQAQPEAEAAEQETAPETQEAEEAAVETEAPEQVQAPTEVKATDATDATDAAEADATEAGQEEQPVADEQKAQEAEAKDEKKGKAKRKKKKDAAAGPQVKIISLPDPSEQAATPAETPTRRAPSRPGPRTSRPGRPAAPGPGQAPTADTPSKRRRKKDKRVVEFPQHLSEEENRRKASLQAKRRKGGDMQERSGGKARHGKRRKQPFDITEVASQTMAEMASQPLKATKRKIRIDEAIRVSDMAHQMGVKAQALIKVLLSLGVMATINQALDMETATLVATEFGYEVERVGFSEDDYLVPKENDSPEALKPRPPVVTIMGHVDHGKTSLLDAIRKSAITSGEAGGITQHIGAYHVPTDRGEVVFLDTPGHEAFTAMRARGAQVTDVVVLVVAADDGVMDQTREAINHSKAANVPIIVAVNKIDKEGADPERVRRELAELGLLPEDWGGETIYADVSAKQGLGLDNLLELILLQAEVLELKANPDKPARGHIVEARLDKGRGPLGTVLIQEGTLREGDVFVCGLFNGRVRSMFNDQGKKVKEAGPAIPVEVQGLEGVPEAGDEFACVEDEKVARRIASARQLKQRERDLAKGTKVTLESFLSTRADQEEAQVLNLILKADVQGSLEAVTDALNKLSTEEVKVDIKHGGAGAITETDIMLAAASEAIVIGFNVKPTAKVKEVAEREQVDIRFYDIIYKLVNEIKDAMSGMLAPSIKEVYLGQAEVRDTFSVPKVGTIAGCGVVDGKILRNAGVRLLRDGVVTYTGKVSSLKRFKDDAKEVLKGYECGIGLENFNDIKVGDVIEAFEEVEEARTLE